MNKTYFTIIFSLLFLISFAQEKALENPEDFLTEISKISKETKSIEANFIQEKSVSYLKEKSISSGKFYTQNGNMRWEQTKPNSYVMLLSEEGVKIKDDGKEKQYGSMADKFMGQIRNILLSSINGSFADNKDFSPSYFETETSIIVKLNPINRRLSKMFKGINLSFDKKSSRLKILTFVQEDGESTMVFSNEIFNKALSNSLFTTF